MKLFYKNIAKNPTLAAERPVKIGERTIRRCTVTLSLQVRQRKLYLSKADNLAGKGK